MKIIADENIPFVTECFSSIGQLEAVPGRAIKPDIVADADILLVRSVTPVGRELLAGSSIRFVATATIGVEHIDTDYLSHHGIGFASAPGSNANSVAEYIVAALLSIAEKKKIQLQASTIGIVGVGNVGSKVEKKARSLGMKVHLNDPPLKRQTGNAKYLPLKKLLDCDFLTLHTPLTFEGIDKTYHLADEKFFDSLKTGCVFLNSSRGAVVDSNALKTAIKSGKLAASVLDVWENEPVIDAELLELVDIGTPHISGYSLDGKIAGTIMIYKAVCEYFALETRFDVNSFLPEPVVPRLEVNPKDKSEQEVLLGTVEKIYDINKDDSELRWMLDRPQGKRGAFFDKLRKDYPVRREFQNTYIDIEDKNSSLAKTLEGIGFLLP